MNRIRKYLWICLATSLVFCCSDNHATGSGFGSETTNGVKVAGRALPGTVVIARHADALSANGDSVATTTVGRDSLFAFSLPVGGWFLEGRNGSNGFKHNVTLQPSDSSINLGSLTGEALTTIEGKVQTHNALAKTLQANSSQLIVQIYGLGRSAAVSNDGTFRIDSVPAGAYAMRVEQGDSLVAEASLSAGKLDSITLGTKGILVENFDGGPYHPSIGTLLTGATWLNWLFKDTTVKSTPALTSDDLTPLWTDSSAYAGKSLHVSVTVPEPCDTPPALLLVLGSRGNPAEWENVHDLSLSDSVVFMEKGVGTATLDVWANTTTNSAYQHLTLDFALDSNWTRKAIAWRDLLASQKAIGNTWTNYRVLKLTWVLKKSAELWLDDIRIPDLSPIDLLAPKSHS